MVFTVRQFTYCKAPIPNVGTRHSHAGNILSPKRWSFNIFAPNNIEQFVYQKCPNPSRLSLETPLYKGILEFSSLPWSLPYLSYIPPVISPICLQCVSLASWIGCEGRREGYGRVMGGIENISPVLKPLCTKAFQKITGEMRGFCHLYLCMFITIFIFSLVAFSNQ